MTVPVLLEQPCRTLIKRPIKLVTSAVLTAYSNNLEQAVGPQLFQSL